MKELRFQTELELWLEFCDECGYSKKLHKNTDLKCKFKKRKLPTKKALKRAESVIEEPTVDDVIAIAKLIDEIKHSTKE